MYKRQVFHLDYAPKYEHELAICSMFQNEAPYLKEWLDYHHHILGVTHFYLYNNGSTDHFEEVLAPYIKEGLVELIEWKSCEKNALYHESVSVPFVAYQIGAFNDCLKKRAFGKVRWVSVQDIDEYIVPIHGASSFKKLLKKASTVSLKELLKNSFRAPKTKIGSFKLHWLVFGTSNLQDLDPKVPLTQQLYLRAQDNHHWHRHTKSIHRPEAVDFCIVHEALLNKNYKYKELNISEFRIHHYWSGSEKQLIKKRGYTKESLEEFSKEFNATEDKAVFPYLEKLKKLSSLKIEFVFSPFFC